MTVKQSQYAQLQRKFSALSQREKWLMLIASVVGLALLGYFLLIEPQQLNNQRLRNQTQQLEEEIYSLDEQIVQLSMQQSQDPNSLLRQQIDTLDSQLQQMSRDFASHINSLVPAEQMTQVLKQMLAQTKGVHLVELASVAPQPAQTPTQQSEQQPTLSESQPQVLFKQGVSLTLQGSYFDILQYLQKMESQPWQFYWQRFNYQVVEYPVARVEIRVYTLSTSESFIDV